MVNSNCQLLLNIHFIENVTLLHLIWKLTCFSIHFVFVVGGLLCLLLRLIGRDPLEVIFFAAKGLETLELIKLFRAREPFAPRKGWAAE